MRLRPAVFAIIALAAESCWFAARAQQQMVLPLDPPEVAAIAAQISQRAEQLKPLLGQVHPADWVARGAPETYATQWNSLGEQNKAVQTDMAVVSEHTEDMPGIMKAIFRVHRFDSDLQALIPAIRRYQDTAIADQIDAVSAGDQRAIEKLQNYVLDLAGEKERLLQLEDREAQRCRGVLANQPIARPTPPKKTTGNSR